MKKTIVGILAGATLALGHATSAQAAAFLNVDVSGTSVTCNTSQAFTASNCGAGFAAVPNGDSIVFTPALAVNGVTFTGVLSAGGEGTGAARAGTATFNALNSSGSARTITVSFAVNDFTLPSGSPVMFNATQSLDNLSGPAVTSAFTGWGNSANTLLAGPGNGVPSVTPTCSDIASPPTSSCATNGPQVSFARVGNFALNGVQSFTIANNQSVSAQASVVTAAVPEPASMLLLGTGLVALAQTARRRLRNR